MSRLFLVCEEFCVERNVFLSFSYPIFLQKLSFIEFVIIVLFLMNLLQNNSRIERYIASLKIKYDWNCHIQDHATNFKHNECHYTPSNCNFSEQYAAKNVHNFISDLKRLTKILNKHCISCQWKICQFYRNVTAMHGALRLSFANRKSGFENVTSSLLLSCDFVHVEKDQMKRVHIS